MPCKVREGADVKNFRDVQNLVTSAIFRQLGTFTFKDIQATVDARLEDSELAKSGKRSSEVNIDSIIKNTIEQLLLANRIYYPEGFEKCKFCLSCTFPIV